MKFWKSTIIVFAFLTMTILSTTVGYAQFWETLLGVGSAMLENHIENSSSYSSQEKESMRNNINTINSAINANQNARNATKDAYQGNYTGTVIQSTQTIMNAAGNHSYDTYLNSANQINKANREYEQDIQNGMDKDAALDKRNTTIGNSAAESVIELQDRIARERAEKDRQQREAERQFSGNNYYYSETSSNETSNMKSYTSNTSNTSNVKVSSPNNSINKNRDNNVNKNRSFNSNAKTLSSTNAAVFKTDNGDIVFLSIPIHSSGEGFSLSYNNQSGNAIRLNCNKASVRVKYYGDDMEHNYMGSCSFVMPSHSDSKIELSKVFPNLPNSSSIESVRVVFVDTQITEEKELNGNKNGSNINNIRNSNSNGDVHLLTKNKIVKFFIGEEDPVALGIDEDSGRLFYNNIYNDRDVKLSCNKVSIKVKYYGDDYEQTLTDACSFVMRANTYDYLDWSDVFFSISDTKVIESIKVLFENTQIR